MHSESKRMSAFYMLICALVFAVSLTPSALAAETPSSTLYVRCGRLMISADEALKGPTTMVVKNGKIAAVGVALPMPVGSQELDLSRYTVVPGFIDAHIHLWIGEQVDGKAISYGLEALRASKAMEYALKRGVVGVRVLHTDGFIDVALHDAIEEGTIDGPRMLPGGYALTIPAGHGDWFDLPSTMPLDDYYTPLHGFVNSPADAEKAVHLQIKYGARIIKMLATGGAGSPLDSFDDEHLSPEEMRVIVEQAHMHHLTVAAHILNVKTALDALHAGIDSIEHASELNKEVIDYMKAHHVWWDPTVYIVDTYVTGVEKGPTSELNKGRLVAAKHFASFKLGLQSGLAPQLLAGSDMKYEPGGGTVLDEMITLVKYGATPKQALIAATKNGAAAAGWDDMGTLAVGKQADFVALDGDPTEDIYVVKKIKSVVFQGKVIVPPQ